MFPVHQPQSLQLSQLWLGSSLCSMSDDYRFEPRTASGDPTDI